MIREVRTGVKDLSNYHNFLNLLKSSSSLHWMLNLSPTSQNLMVMSVLMTSNWYVRGYRGRRLIQMYVNNVKSHLLVVYILQHSQLLKVCSIRNSFEENIFLLYNSCVFLRSSVRSDHSHEQASASDGQWTPVKLDRQLRLSGTS